jgi:hypothetical protein
LADTPMVEVEDDIPMKKTTLWRIWNTDKKKQWTSSIPEYTDIS